MYILHEMISSTVWIHDNQRNHMYSYPILAAIFPQVKTQGRPSGGSYTQDSDQFTSFSGSAKNTSSPSANNSINHIQDGGQHACPTPRHSSPTEHKAESENERGENSKSRVRDKKMVKDYLEAQSMVPAAEECSIQRLLAQSLVMD